MAKKYMEELFNILPHKVNANQNYPEICISPKSEWQPSRKQTTNAGEDAGKKEPSYIVGGNIN
jgi:hypothetical protein